MGPTVAHTDDFMQDTPYEYQAVQLDSRWLVGCVGWYLKVEGNVQAVWLLISPPTYHTLRIKWVIIHHDLCRARVWHQNFSVLLSSSGS